MAAVCTHLDGSPNEAPVADGCVECLQIGQRWVHLRRCLACGHVGCCDNSIGKHATGHFHETTHPLIQSFEPGEDWLWCYVDDAAFEAGGFEHSPSHP